MRVGHFLQALHDSEINWLIACQFDGVWLVRIGCDAFSLDDYDDSNCAAATDECGSFVECLEWLGSALQELYPDSTAARQMRQEAVEREKDAGQ